jgi:hypothetical protein
MAEAVSVFEVISIVVTLVVLRGQPPNKVSVSAMVHDVYPFELEMIIF